MTKVKIAASYVKIDHCITASNRNNYLKILAFLHLSWGRQHIFCKIKTFIKTLEWVDDPVSQLLILNMTTSQETCYSI